MRSVETLMGTSCPSRGCARCSTTTTADPVATCVYVAVAIVPARARWSPRRPRTGAPPRETSARRPPGRRRRRATRSGALAEEPVGEVAPVDAHARRAHANAVGEAVFALLARPHARVDVSGAAPRPAQRRWRTPAAHDRQRGAAAVAPGRVPARRAAHARAARERPQDSAGASSE